MYLTNGKETWKNFREINVTPSFPFSSLLPPQFKTADHTNMGRVYFQHLDIGIYVEKGDCSIWERVGEEVSQETK